MSIKTSGTRHDKSDREKEKRTDYSTKNLPKFIISFSNMFGFSLCSYDSIKDIESNIT